MSEAFIGDIRILPFNFPPRGWAQCDGQILAIAQNQALFSILGTTYGGNGVSTFALPNLKGRTPIGWGTGPGLSNYALGQLGGEVSHTLSANETPQHNHTVAASTLAPVQGSPLGGVWADVPNGYLPAAPNALMNSQSLSSVGGQPHENMSPYLALNFCICLIGIFPSRN